MSLGGPEGWFSPPDEQRRPWRHIATLPVSGMFFWIHRQQYRPATTSEANMMKLKIDLKLKPRDVLLVLFAACVLMASSGHGFRRLVELLTLLSILVHAQ